VAGQQADYHGDKTKKQIDNPGFQHFTKQDANFQA
jgi:hypothetical protein